LRLIQSVCLRADKGSHEQVVDSVDVPGTGVTFRVEVKPENRKEIIPKVLCTFAYSLDGREFAPLGSVFLAREGVWVGAKVGLFSSAPELSAATGYADVDWFRVRTLRPTKDH
jgi:hypothetical protein